MRCRVRCLPVLIVALLLTLAACDDGAAPTGTIRSSDLPGADAAGSLPTCGFEGDLACVLPPRCDRGLDVHANGTLRLDDDTCVNDTRHLVGASFRGTWPDWALANQRTLAIDEPINWVQHLSTHNANNNIAEGETFDPNQVWSLSDQLDLGSRFLWLDLHWVAGRVRLCHAIEVEVGPVFHAGCGPADRWFDYAVKELATWLDANPGEIVMIDLEAWTEDHNAETAAPLEAYLGSRLYRATDRTDGTRWPTRRELLESGKQVIVMGRGVNIAGINHSGWIEYGQADRFVVNLQLTRVRDIVVGCQSAPGGEVPVELIDVGNQFRVIGEDRTTLSRMAFNTGIMESEAVATLAACNVPLQSLDMLSAMRPGPLPLWMMSEIGQLLLLPRRVPLGEYQANMVWSWTEDDRGQHGNAALLRGSTGRWSSAPTSGQHRFACARERSETRQLGIGTGAWPDRLGDEWRVTTRSGAWRDGGRACLEEFGAQGFVYSVPKNGHMNGRLRLANESGGNVWLSYNDIADDGQWVISRRPLALAGDDVTLECEGHPGTIVQLHATAASDPDGHALTFEWRGPFGTVTGAQPTVTIPVGTHEIILIVDDGFGGASADTMIVKVIDTTPPVIHSASILPDTLWAPNHAMVPAVVTVDVTDICDAAPSCRIVSVSSSEPADGRGDGNTQPDWRLTAALVLELRAERAGTGDGRVYTIRVECSDASLNVATTEVRVTVPHDRRR